MQPLKGIKQTYTPPPHCKRLNKKKEFCEATEQKKKKRNEQSEWGKMRWQKSTQTLIWYSVKEPAIAKQ